MDEDFDIFNRLNKYLDTQSKNEPPSHELEGSLLQHEVNEEDIEAVLGADLKKKKPSKSTQKNVSQKKDKKDGKQSAISAIETKQNECEIQLVEEVVGCEDITQEVQSTGNRNKRSRGRPRKQQRSGNRLDSEQSQELNSSAISEQNIIQSVSRTRSGRASNNSRGRTRRDIYRAHRQCVAEHAARLPTIETIDLITSPSIPITGTIVIDSDEEKVTAVDAYNDVEADNSFTASNPEIRVKIKWMGEIQIHILRKYQQFGDLMKIFAEQNDAEIQDVMLNIDDYIIEESDTPDSLNYNICTFISGRIVKDSSIKDKTNKKRETPKDPSALEFKIQSDQWKRPLMVSIKNTDTFKILYIKCSEQLKVPPTQIKLSFDGDPMEMEQTPEDFEMEGGEAIDCRIKK